MKRPAVNRRSQARLHKLVRLASWMPPEPGGKVYISAYCPNPNCGIHYIQRPARWLAMMLADWPSDDAVVIPPSRIHRKGKLPLVVESTPADETCIPHPTLLAPLGRVPTKLYCYACGGLMKHYDIGGYKRSALLGASR